MKLSMLLLLVCLSAQSQTFREEEISFTQGDAVLAGTLSFPSAEAKKYKAIVLISGSGPQNRDSEIVGMKPFKLLADFFNAQGYAVLRYDDRGVGKSTGSKVSEVTSQVLAEDAAQAFRYLKSRSDIHSTKIGLLGHSEGGILAPMVCTKEPGVAFVILMAGYGVKGIDLSNAQQAAILKASGMTEEFIAASNAMNREVMKLMASETVTDVQLTDFVKAETLKLLPLLPEAMRAAIPDQEGYATMTANQALAQSKNTWIKFYMNYDPQPALTKITCPALLLFGELDAQVLPGQNKDLMAQAITGNGNKKVQATVISKANHLFQLATSGSPMEYSMLKKEFSPELLDTLNNWLQELK